MLPGLLSTGIDSDWFSINDTHRPRYRTIKLHEPNMVCLTAGRKDNFLVAGIRDNAAHRFIEANASLC